jgi:hypothetical protein
MPATRCTCWTLISPPCVFGSGSTLLDVAEGNEREQALALVQAGEFALVDVGIAGKGMLRPRTSSFLVWTSSKPEARRRAHAYCEARGWQLDWVPRGRIDWSGNRPVALWGDALSVHVNPRRYVRSAQQCVRRGAYEPLPKQGD